jgi:hypothetical protein
MAEAIASAVIPVPADQVWAQVRDFDGLPSWHPAITESTLDPPGPATVGVIRHLTLADGASVSERLLSIDDAARRTSYEFTASPFPVRRYRAAISVLPVTASGQAFVLWSAEFDCEAAAEADLTELFARQVFAVGLAALSEAAASRPQA